MKISCMIVEDEPVSQEILKRYIDDFEALELIAICDNAIDASQKMLSVKPDLLFLDITMPRLSGLDFYKSLINPPPVIFTTAYPEYAVNGFEVSAIDYLVKPFGFDRFVKAINKVQDLLRSTNKIEGHFIVLQADKKFHKINLDAILYIEAMGDYVKLMLEGKTLIVHQTLQRITEQLPAQYFFRVHKSYVISLRKLEYVEGNQIVMQAHKIPIGQTYRSEFLSVLQQNAKISKT